MSDAPNPYLPDDEISLRDLYLILRKGLSLILLISIVAAVMTFIVLSFLPSVYEAESTALVTPPAITIDRVQNLTFNPSSDITFEAYETLAQSRGVLEATVAAVPAAKLEYNKLSGSVKKLVGPDRPGQLSSLLVTHSVKNKDPELAAALANAWASNTLDTVSASLLANIAPLSETTQREFAGLSNNLQAAEQALADFDASDTSLSLAASTQQLARLIADAEASLSSQGNLEARAEFSDTVSQTLLSSSYTNLSQAVAAAEARLASLETASGLSREAALQRAELAGLRAQLNALDEQLATYQARYSAAQRELAAATQTRRQLERNLANAETAYQAVATLQPFIDYAAALSPSNTSLLNEAAIPSKTANPSKLLGSLIALILAGLLSILFVFLREAVKGE